MLSLGTTLALERQMERQAPLQVQVFDVGQGQSLLFSSAGETALLDCGSSNSYRSSGDLVADTVLEKGYSHLQAVILTHYHADHANGLTELLTRVKADCLYLPEVEDATGMRCHLEALAEEYDIPIVYVRQEMQIPCGMASLTLYPPIGKAENEACLSLRCSYRQFALLATGDMGEGTEALFCHLTELPQTAVLVAGHHGANTSTSAELLERLAPQVGIISVGDNRYGHPSAETLWRMQEQEMTVYRTDLQGNIQIQVY